MWTGRPAIQFVPNYTNLQYLKSNLRLDALIIKVMTMFLQQPRCFIGFTKVMFDKGSANQN